MSAMTPPFVTSATLSADGLRHGWFGRRGGVSTGVYESLNCGLGSADTAANVAENRARVAAVMGLAGAERLVGVHQVHSPDVVEVTAPFAEDRPRADAMVTRTPGIGLCILTADCAPVLLADVGAGVIGAAHAGWRGAVSGVIEATAAAMEAIGAQRGRIRAAIGPCIALESYQVGEEFRSAVLAVSDWAEGCFSDAFGERPHFDLRAYVAGQLSRAGIDGTDVLAQDTYADARDWHSHRRGTHLGEADYGRNAAVIVRSGD